jgi:hypothetical protein
MGKHSISVGLDVHRDFPRRAEEAGVLQPDAEVHAIDPHIHVVAVGEAALLEGTVLGLPLVAPADNTLRLRNGCLPRAG